MFETDQEIIIAILASSALLLLFAGIIILSALNYKNKQRVYQRQLLMVKEDHEKEMLKASIEVREQTLQNIAQEIHDNVGQVLSLVKLNLNIATQKSESEVVKLKLKDSIELTTKAISDLRDLSRTMNAEYLKNQSLGELLILELKQLEKTGSFKTSLDISGDQRSLNTEDRIIIYRMIQEIIQNILKHAHASKINVVLDYQLADRISIAVKDNGIGFDINSKITGSGIHNLKHRSNLINADFSIESQIGSGTEVVLKLKSV